MRPPISYYASKTRIADSYERREALDLLIWTVLQAIGVRGL